MNRPVFDQSAVIPYRVGAAGLEIAMITSMSGKRWVIPKGLIDPGESGPQSAARECEEEAGLQGEVDPSAFGRFEYEKWGGVCHVDVYLMRVTVELDEWLESDQRQREWVDVDEAIRRVREPELTALIQRLSRLIDA